jgi:adenosylhomocysteine nucleosidase
MTIEDSREAGPIALVMATRMEAQPFVDALRLALLGKVPCPLYRNNRVILAVCGVGKTNAAIATTYISSVFHPSVILNLGAAGATGPRCGLGGIFHITEVCEPDRPRFPLAEPCIHRLQTLSGFDVATLATHDRPIIEIEDRERTSLHAEMVDMEGAAVAQAARRFSIPCLLFKFVSDTSEQTDTAATIDYMRSYSRVFCGFVVERVMPRLGERGRD